ITIGKLPAGAVIKPSMKRTSITTTTGKHVCFSSCHDFHMDCFTFTIGAPLLKTPKFVLQSPSYGISNNSVSWQTSTPVVDIKKEALGDAISSLPPNTIIKATTRPSLASSSNGLSSYVNASSVSVSTPAAAPAVASAVRQAVFLNRDMQQRTVRSMTLGAIDVASTLYLGLSNEHLPLFKRHICKFSNLTHMDCCITLRKLRLNEPFTLLAEFFELTESVVKDTFKRTLVKLARCLRPLIRWSDAKHYSERLKHMPLAYRSNLLHVRSLIECVETEVCETLDFGCASYKFILCLNTNGIISYVSDAFRGDSDDLQLFETSRFKDIIPSYLTLCAEPGKAVRRTHSTTKPKSKEHDSTADEEADALEEATPTKVVSRYSEQRLAGQMANMQSLCVSDGALTSTRATSLQLPTLRVNEPACRTQMRRTVDALREFKMLEHGALQQTALLAYLNEMLIVAAALCNLQQQ
ncbi:hypothetical protein KR093_005562, partial [Drosophila rubida]